MDSVLNPTLPKRKKKNGDVEESEETDISGFANLLKPGKCDSSYEYNLQTTMQIINHNKKSSDTNFIQMAHGETSSLVSMSKQNMLVITDWKNESSVMIRTSTMSYSVISLNAMSGILKSKEAKEELEADNKLTFKKTGRTKVICNYTCYEYVAQEGDKKHVVWATKEIDFDSEKLAKSMSSVTKQNFNALPEGGGYLMELISYKNNKIESQMRVTNVNTNPLKIDIKNYKKN